MDRLQQRRISLLLLGGAFLLSAIPSASAYDPLDPLGNVTIVWDVLTFNDNHSYTVEVSVINYHQIRTVTNWTLTWTWPGKEFIENARGAEATVRGECQSLIQKGFHVHSCLKSPTLVDMQPVTPPPVAGCCHGGFLGSQIHKPDESKTVFQIDIQNANRTLLGPAPTGEQDSTPLKLFPAPKDVVLGVPGYSCTPAFMVSPINHTNPGSVRTVPSPQTFMVVCTYRKPPTGQQSCCVSFSAFYNPDVTPCPNCACACGAFPDDAAICLQEVDPSVSTPLLADGHNSPAAANLPNSLVCSHDGCPLHIRFHIKENYDGYWRAKVTVFNRRFQRNFSDWNLVLQHPSMGNITQVVSFNSTSLFPYGVNNTAAFSGIPFYNSWLMSATTDSGPGFVQSELLFGKGPDFTLSKGWAFPEKISFMGEECVLPSSYPTLPNSSPRQRLMSLFMGLPLSGLLSLAVAICFFL